MLLGGGCSGDRVDDNAGMDRDTAEDSREHVPERAPPATGSHPPCARRSLSDGVRGVLWMLLGMSCIGLVDGVAKFLAVRLHGIEVAWGYFVASFACAAAYALAKRGSRARLLRSRRPWLQAGRAACLVGSLSCLFVSLHYLPLAEATAINFTGPLFIVALSGPLLGERVDLGRWLAVSVGMAGALIVVQPGGAVFHWASVLPLVGAFFFALLNIVTRLLRSADSTLTTLLHTFGIGSALISLSLPFVWATPTPTECLVFAAAGVLGFAAHFSIVRSLELADASRVAPLNYVRLVWAIGIGFVVFGDLPEATTIAGGAIIVASGLYVLYREAEAGRRGV